MAEKIILLDGFSENDVRAFIEFYKKSHNLPPAIIAVSTDATRQLPLKQVILTLQQKHESG
ncbi:DUF3783 domain-containing protein [Candidatus Micrarchaeota archaeon]|nr:DUF3783 domain-containing protein [Candidatus Micrarchaeota archaeon]